MSLRKSFLLAFGAVLFLSGCVATSNTASVQPDMSATAAETDSEAKKLAQLFHDSDEANLRRNPASAISRGDLRYADQLGDYITDAYYAAEKAAAEADLAALAGIDRAKLSATDQIAYDVFQYRTEGNLKDLAPDMLALTKVRPINHFFGIHTFYPTFASGQGAAPFKTLLDYENNLKRHRDYVLYLDRAIGRFREGLASGVVDTKLTIKNVIEQLDRQLAENPETSSLYKPVLNFPEGFPESEKDRLRGAYRAAIVDDIYPAYRRLRAFLQDEYLPKAREGVGLVYMKDGLKLYDRLIESNTTLPLKANEVHALGLREVARILSEMETIKSQVGFTGSLAEFFEYLRKDPKFRPASAEALRDGFYAIGRRVDARIAEQFSTIPKTPLEIRPYPAFREKNEALGSYERGTPDGSRPGIFYFNTYDLPSRSVNGMETLYLHEAVPGHHFQISLAQENETLPAFMRFDFSTAFGEGWALYAESLWQALGMETDPYQRFGGLNDEMLRAMRLVVDTGIHAKGWSREQAIAYMLDNSGMDRTEVTAEVERYIAIPGQALGYKIGALTILRLKAKAKAALGDRFDPREFHTQVLMTGSLPLTVLEHKIDTWIASKKG